MDIFKEIKKEHEEFRKLSDEINETTDRAIKTRQSKFEKLYIDLTAHHEAEEAVLVPKLKENKDTKDMGLEILEEHHVIEDLLEKLKNLPVDDETWIIKFGVMKEIMEHHLDEEENEISEEAHKQFDQKTLDSLGEQFEMEEQKQKEKLLSQK
ncbi:MULTISPECIES: hemerythrin domain-containing protein [Acetoanaerobium]|uniref:hemerythrin domain-containing protein n=1 Tax=Acetoanaerobium TaxID=186831 RepID=UPI00331D27FC